MLKLNLGQRIALTLTILVLTFLLVGAYTGTVVRGLSAQSRQVIAENLTQLVRMATVQQNLLQLRRAEKDISIDLLMNMARVPQRVTEWRHHADQLQAHLTEAIANEPDSGISTLLSEAQAGQQQYTQHVGRVIARIESKEILDQAIYEEEIAPPVQLALVAEDKLAQAIARQREVTTRGGQEVTETVNGLIGTLLLGTLIVVVGGVVMGGWLVQRIRRPLSLLTDGITRLRQGQLTRHVVIQSRDELGRMSEDFNGMMDELTLMVGAVLQAADSIHGASAQIAQGNLDLSQRTESAAARLQQAAAVLQALADATGRTARDANEAGDIAQAASRQAGAGGAIMKQVVRSMEGIQSSSSRIAEITSVIDSIAFQTNILALNAAVEAARAGEQGRGFAVVAGEVRSLAQRSAEAAREIKVLIDGSRQQVDEGSRLVHQAGESMSRIVEQVQRVDAVIQAIRLDASNQSEEIGQLNASVAGLQDTTLRNAALVEEATAASGSLREQADHLVRAMHKFELDPQRSGRPLLLPA